MPDFYRELGEDPAHFAVLDLPAAYGSEPCDGCWPEVASHYQMFQIVHRKAIAWGYFSHASGDNLVPPVIAAVEARATLGEIADTLRSVFGEHRDTSDT